MVDKETYRLEEAIQDYLLWMIGEGYSHKTWLLYEKTLNAFVHFVKQRDRAGDDIFSPEIFESFLEDPGHTSSSKTAIRGLWRYLFQQKRIETPLKKPIHPLPDAFEDYLKYYETSRGVAKNKLKHIRGVLTAFDDYLQKEKIALFALSIEQLDAFQEAFYQPIKPSTRRLYRSYLRGFLSYLYHERKLLRRDFASLLVGPRLFAPTKPPKFLKAHELQRLLDWLVSSNQLRTYAVVQLASSLGLRPKEISLIRLDDISFRKGELTLKDRKNSQSVVLPLPESPIKAIAAYIIGERPKTKHRSLFLTRNAPYRPITPSRIASSIRDAMHQAGLQASAYWLRHTYAQNLLEAGTSIYEMKEMLGHDMIDSTKKYLHIHIKLMREVLFDESL